MIDSLFEEANCDQAEFISLLKNALEGHRIDSHRLTEIAAAVAPHFSVKRGRKITAASAAHEFLFRQELGLILKRGPYRGRRRATAYEDPRSEATRLEFDLLSFDSRPAKRRLKPRQVQGRQQDRNIPGPNRCK